MARKLERPPHERGLRILLVPFTHFRALDIWRRTALAGVTVIAIGSILSFPDFGWVEAAQLLVAVASVRVLARSVESHPYASPFADGTLLAVGAIWTALVALGNAFFDNASTRSEIVVVIGCLIVFLAGMFIRAGEGREWYIDEYPEQDYVG
ncbi:MAG: hypothetical protein QM648_02825 [Solirubrobacterales bacterium]